MPLWCNTCRCDVSTPCTSHHHHHLPENHSSSFCRKFRSTKGASKARRDHINHEIRNMRALLPVAREDQERLSYLHSMAAICTYIRKSVLLQGLPAGQRSDCSLPYEAFLRALHGFILVTTAQARLVYVSENVTEYLGLSMIDVLQGDTFYDMVESSDVDIVKSNLDLENNSPPERSFICCMQTSKTFKLQRGSCCCSMMVRGTFQSFPQLSLFSSAICTTDQPLFVALCTPTVNQLQSSDSHFCSTFDSVHRMDMTFTHLSDSVSYFLGYSAEEMTGRSWYGLLHPEDLSLSAASHRSLMQADEGLQVEMVLRLQCKDLTWTWIYVRANRDSERRVLRCTNFIIGDTEARYLRTKTSSDAFRPPSAAQQVLHAHSYSSSRCFKRQRASNSQSEEPPGARARRESEPDSHYVPCASCQNDSSPVPLGDCPALFTPPYSPASSGSPLRHEDLGHDHLMDVQGYTDQLLSSPEVSPVYYPHPEAGLACHRSPSSDSLPAVAEHAFDHVAFGALSALSPLSSSSSSSSSSSPTHNFPACASDARLVPDCLSVSDLCEIPVDCVLHQDDLCLLQQPQGGSLDQVHRVPHHVLPVHSSLLTPNQSPASTESNRYSKREQAEISLLAQQISSLASSFTMSHTLNVLPSACDWPRHPPPPPLSPGGSLESELILDDGVFDSILTDLEMSTRRSGQSVPGSHPWVLEEKTLALSPSTITEESLPAERFTVTAGFSVQLGHRDQNAGLHQLSRYTPSGLQQDGLAEENL